MIRCPIGGFEGCVAIIEDNNNLVSLAIASGVVNDSVKVIGE